MSKREQDKKIIEACRKARNELGLHISCYGDINAVTVLDQAIKILEGRL